MTIQDSSRAAKKAQKKADKAHKKAAKKDYDRRHAQLKRQQTMHTALLGAQVKRGKKRDKQQAAQEQSAK